MFLDLINRNKAKALQKLPQFFGQQKIQENIELAQRTKSGFYTRQTADGRIAGVYD